MHLGIFANGCDDTSICVRLKITLLSSTSCRFSFLDTSSLSQMCVCVCEMQNIDRERSKAVDHQKNSRSPKKSTKMTVLSTGHRDVEEENPVDQAVNRKPWHRDCCFLFRVGKETCTRIYQVKLSSKKSTTVFSSCTWRTPDLTSSASAPGPQTVTAMAPICS